MIVRIVQIHGQPGILLCDARCNKAWGSTHRPKRQLSLEEDDYEYLADDELGEAPETSPEIEGDDGKPRDVDERLNKWCARECERSRTIFPGEQNKFFALPDLTDPKPNYLRRR